MKRIILLATIAACSSKTAPPMGGTCVDRSTPNLFVDRDENVSFKECRWRGKVWVCMLNQRTDAWECRAVGVDDTL